MHFLGAVQEPLGIIVPQMMMAHRSVSSSAAGSPSDIEKMLKFVARNGISPTIERFSFSQVNEAIEHVRSGKARYRVVLEH